MSTYKKEAEIARLVGNLECCSWIPALRMFSESWERELLSLKADNVWFVCTEHKKIHLAGRPCGEGYTDIGPFSSFKNAFESERFRLVDHVAT